MAAKLRGAKGKLLLRPILIGRFSGILFIRGSQTKVPMKLLAMNELETVTVLLFVFIIGLVAALDLVNRNKTNYLP
jgi:hypothetical protein